MPTNLKLDYEDTMMIFAAISESYIYADDFVSSDAFYDLTEEDQEAALIGVEMYKNLYKRLATFLEEAGETGAVAFYEADILTTPKKDDNT